MKIIELRDQLAAKLVPIANNGSIYIGNFLTGLYLYGEPFFQGVCACEKLWDYFLQQETRLEIVSTIKEDLNNTSLIGEMRRGNKKRLHRRGNKDKEEESYSSNQWNT